MSTESKISFPPLEVPSERKYPSGNPLAEFQVTVVFTRTPVSPSDGEVTAASQFGTEPPPEIKVTVLIHQPHCHPSASSYANLYLKLDN